MSPNPQKNLNLAARILVLASISWCIGCNIYRVFIDKKSMRTTIAYDKWNGWIAGSLEPDRGIFLEFDHFPNASAGFAQNIYFHTVYTIFPRRALVADPSVTINNAFDIFPSNTYPSDDWLRSRGIGSVMTIVMDPKQKLPVVEHVRWLN